MKQFLKSLKNQKGLSIISALVGSAIALIVVLGITEMINNVYRAQRGIRAADAGRDLIGQMIQVLRDPASCVATFGVAGVGAGQSPKVGGFAANTIFQAGPVARFTVGQQYVNGLIQVTGLQLRNFTNYTTPTVGKSDLIITLSKVNLNNNVLGVIQTSETVTIYTVLDAADQVIQCYALGRADSLWQIDPNNANNIYYNAGFVGVAMNNPQVPLDVAGNMRLNSLAGGALQLHGVGGVHRGDLGINEVVGQFALAANPGDIVLRTSGGRLHFDTSNGVTAAPAMTILNNGFVGINTANPTYNLTVMGNNTVQYLKSFDGTSAGGSPLFIGARSRSSTIGTNAHPLAGDRISDFIGLSDNGGTGSWTGMEIWASENHTDTAKGMRLALATTLNGQANPSPRLDILDNGNIGINNSAPVYRLDVNGDIHTTGCFWDGAAHVGTGACSSDVRLKKNVQDFNHGLKELLGIRLRSFQFNGLGEMPKSEESSVGVIAQELEETNPELVGSKMVKLHPEDELQTEIKTVHYSKFIYIAINAIKQLYAQWKEDSETKSKKFDSLQNDIETLRKEINTLKQENENLKTLIKNRCFKSDTHL